MSVCIVIHAFGRLLARTPIHVARIEEYLIGSFPIALPYHVPCARVSKHGRTTGDLDTVPGFCHSCVSALGSLTPTTSLFHFEIFVHLYVTSCMCFFFTLHPLLPCLLDELAPPNIGTCRTLYVSMQINNINCSYVTIFLLS